MTIKRVFLYFCLISGIFYTALSQAQTINTQNLSSVRVDELSDDQIRAFMRQVESTGLGDSQLEQVALARGMRSEEIQKLRARIEKIKQKDQSKSNQKPEAGTGKVQQPGRELNYTPDTLTTKVDTQTEAEKALGELKAKIFGASLFKNTNLTFEPNLRIATPGNYIIGPDDEIQIDITGDNEANYTLKVNPEGNIRIEYAGIVSLSGLTVEQASAKIRSRLSLTYPGIRSGRTNVSVGIGNIRSIKVTLLGEVVKPGSYTLPSLATAFNALYVSGGPTENGSFREIEIIRGNRMVGKLDIYEFLLKGFQTNNIRLQDNDIIRVPTYRTRVEFAGEVKRPGLFEVIPNETLSDVLNFAGGFSDQAYTSRIKVLQNTDRERRIADIFSDNYTSYKPKSGDKYYAEPILDRFGNRVTIEGAVFRPGQFELEPGLTVGKLIAKAEGLREDAFQSRGYITRLKDDLQTELVSFDIAKILAGQAADIPLKREDVIMISSIFDLKEEYNVRVEGEVLQPGTLSYAEGMTLEDAILQAGGLKESATPQRIEISRRVKNSNPLSRSAQIAEVFQLTVDQDLKATAGFVLLPFDIVLVRTSEGYQVQRQIEIKGEVLFPGIYTLSKKDERISDMIKRAGGFTALAYADGASLKRPGPTKDSLDFDQKNGNDQLKRLQAENKQLKQIQLENERSIQYQRLQSTVSDTVKVKEEAIRTNFVGINLLDIMKKPGSRPDIFLEEGDILNIPRQLQTVKISGQVLSPVTIVYSRSKGFKQYISNAGGFNQKARKKNAYIIYANGSAKSTQNFVFFKIFPDVKPGAEIFVPQREEKRKLSAAELIGISGGLASLAVIILNLVK